MKKFLALGAILLLTACSEGPPASVPPDLTFANYEPIAVNAATVEVVNAYKPSWRDPNIEHTFRLPTYTAAERLLSRQLVAAGSENTLRATIEEASVTRTALPQDKGLAAYYMQQQTDRLQAKVIVRFELVDPKAPDIILGHANIVTSREKTLTENMSPVEREQAYFDLTEDTMDAVNDGLKTIVRGTFGKQY